MENLINMLINNYIWIIVITGILLFSLIGFLVDSSKNKELNETDHDMKEEKIKTKDSKKSKHESKNIKKSKEDEVPTIAQAMQQQALEKQANNEHINSNESTSVDTNKQSDKKEIVDNDYDLSINRYKEIKYVPVKYPPTKDILAEIKKLDEEASKDLQELKNMLEK